MNAVGNGFGPGIGPASGLGTGVTLGVPGVYVLPPTAVPSLVTEPLDVAAFVGVAPRGPAWERVVDPTLVERAITRARSVPVVVDSWDDYRQRFGGFEGPGLLPHAVAAFFAQGGRRALVLRIVHNEAVRDADGYLQPLGCAEHEFVPGAVRTIGGAPLRVRARNEGSWGDRLRLTLAFTVRPVRLRTVEPASLVLADGADLPVGSLLRLCDDAGVAVLRRVIGRERRGRPQHAAVDIVVTLDAAPGFAPTTAEEVLADLGIVDDDPLLPRAEQFAGLGLSAAHPRWLATVVAEGSRLIEVVDNPSGLEFLDVQLPPAVTQQTVAGRDRWASVTPSDMFGDLLLGDDAGTHGLDALVHAPETASVVVADLYSPAPVSQAQPVWVAGVFAGPAFAPCLLRPAEQHPPPPDDGLVGLRLDPRTAADLEVIVGWQQQLVDTATRLNLVALLDVPPGLPHRAVLRWRSRFNSSWAVAYHPWLRSPLAGLDRALQNVPPSAVAAGLIARSELRSGVPRGPANEPASAVVDVATRLGEPRHAELHLAGVNVFALGPGGVWLTGERTLCDDRQLRHLTQRRLLQLVERAVGRQLAWAVFEPNNEALRAGVRRMIGHLLGDLYARGAFTGRTAAESWFVHIPADAADSGQLVVEIGLALSVPLEYILLRVTLDGGGGLSVRTIDAPAVTAHG